MTAPADEQAVGIDAIAHLLQVSPDTVRRKAKTGDLPGFKVGHVWRFFPSAVRAHLEKPADLWAMPPASKRARRAA